MNFGIYMILDKASEQYGLPFVQPTVKSAKRSIALEMLETADTVVKDFVVFEVGQFDKDEGTIESYGKQAYIPVLQGDEILEDIHAYRKILDNVREKVQNEEIDRQFSESLELNKEENK